MVSTDCSFELVLPAAPEFLLLEGEECERWEHTRVMTPQRGNRDVPQDNERESDEVPSAEILEVVADGRGRGHDDDDEFDFDELDDDVEDDEDLDDDFDEELDDDDDFDDDVDDDDFDDEDE